MRPIGRFCNRRSPKGAALYPKRTPISNMADVYDATAAEQGAVASDGKLRAYSSPSPPPPLLPPSGKQNQTQYAPCKIRVEQASRDGRAFGGGWGSAEGGGPLASPSHVLCALCCCAGHVPTRGPCAGALAVFGVASSKQVAALCCWAMPLNLIRVCFEKQKTLWTIAAAARGAGPAEPRRSAKQPSPSTARNWYARFPHCAQCPPCGRFRRVDVGGACC